MNMKFWCTKRCYKLSHINIIPLCLISTWSFSFISISRNGNFPPILTAENIWILERITDLNRFKLDPNLVGKRIQLISDIGICSTHFAANSETFCADKLQILSTVLHLKIITKKAPRGVGMRRIILSLYRHQMYLWRKENAIFIQKSCRKP